MGGELCCCCCCCCCCCEAKGSAARLSSCPAKPVMLPPARQCPIAHDARVNWIAIRCRSMQIAPQPAVMCGEMLSKLIPNSTSDCMSLPWRRVR